jgi:NADPH:quinone reductase-like Zn-dependent oxidoreductase
MKAVIGTTYRPPERLEFADVDVPGLRDGTDMLLRVHAASVNSLDWRTAMADPAIARAAAGWRRPKRPIRGADVAGVVESVGEGVTRFRPGDAVFGVASGSFAEYVCADESELTLKPAELSFADAAALPVAGCTALQALRRAQLGAGQSVLINGAGGGVGSFAVQIAKALGAQVTAATSTGNVEFVRSLGADEVIDYTKDDFTARGVRYDLIADIGGNRSLRDLRRAMTAHGSLVLIGGGGGRMLGPVSQLLRAKLMNPFISQRVITMIAKVDAASLDELVEFHSSGRLTSAIGRTCSLPETPDAIQNVCAGHARGKTVILVSS